MARMYTSPPKFSEIPNAIRQDVPVYRLRDEIYTDDTLFVKGTTIESDPDWVPNLSCFPLNDVALKAYRAFLTAYDDLGRQYSKKENKGYVPKLPAFEREWELMTATAKAKNVHLAMVIDRTVPILGAPRAKSAVRAVDTTMMPQVAHVDETAIGKGNTLDKDNAINTVKASLSA